MTASDAKKFRKIAREGIVLRYGKGLGSAWLHMSEQQRADALLAQAAHIVLMQADETAARLTMADAQEMLRAIVAEGAES